MTINENDYQEYRKTLVRYGTIVEDESLEVNGNHYRSTDYELNGNVYTVNMKNGKVESITVK